MCAAELNVSLLVGHFEARSVLYPPETALWDCARRWLTVRAIAAGASSGIAKHELALISHRT